MTFLKMSGRALALLGAWVLFTMPVLAEDIDIFVGSASESGLPNVLFVLDNTSNWARQSQQWPGGLQQGQSEVRAIKTALADLTGKVNIGVVEFTTAGNANQDGGFVRFNLQKLTDASRTAINGQLDAIFNDVNGTLEKRNAGTSYGNLMYDVYNYLAGDTQSFSGAGTDADRADEAAYSANYSKFLSPLTEASACGKTYVIFIGNPNSNGPSGDSTTNSTKLAALYAAAQGTADGLAGSSGSPVPIPLPGFTTTTTVVPGTSLGTSSACYISTDASSCTTNEYLTGGKCSGLENCSCDATPAGLSTAGCSKIKGTQYYKMPVVTGGSTTTTVTESPTQDATSGRAWNFDDWAKFLNVHGVPITITPSTGAPYVQRVPVITYTIDVFNKSPNAEHSALMFSGAKVGGGRYFQAKSETAIVDAINTALSDILSVSSTFAAVTLPLSATNRAQSKNQVYIGMFRPDQTGDPRWFGNFKRYQIGLFNGEPKLADAQLKEAINPLSNFAAECSESFWSSDSASYWQTLGITPSLASQCLGTVNSVWSDLPDGPFVEKGGAAQVSRKSTLANRKVLTVPVGGNALSALTNAAFGGSNAVLAYFKGTAIGAGETAAASGGRPSIHGDVVHSRPLTINYGDATGTYIYYGANDGLFRSIRARTGEEEWSLIASEHYDQVKRLYDNSPLVKFPNQPDASATPKGYFFDGSSGSVINYDANDEIDLAYIFPTMRRGGRMVYGLNVTDPANPALLWRLGCPNLTDDVGCSTGFSALGQTWSTPTSALLEGNSLTKPVLIFGGGYDNCLDADQAAYPCAASAKGKGVYVLDAAAGTLLAGPTQLATDGPVVADVARVDVDNDGYTDFAYVADATGSLYRVSFASMDVAGQVTSLSAADWTISKVASMSGTSRRFLNQPVVLALGTAAYITLGSGNRERPLETNYPYTSSVQDRFYMFADRLTEVGKNIDLDGSLLLNVTQDPNATAEQCAAQGARGWYTNFAGRGEQVVNPAAIGAGQVFFNTYRPGGSSAGLCARPLGVSTAASMDLFSPSACDTDRFTELAGGGMPISPVITTVCLNCSGPDDIDNPENYEYPPNQVCVSGDCDPDDSTKCAVGGTCEFEDADPIVVTVVIGGKEGLNSDRIIATPPASRVRTYFNSDIDR